MYTFIIIIFQTLDVIPLLLYFDYYFFLYNVTKFEQIK